jgi:hypothetical protein
MSDAIYTKVNQIIDQRIRKHALESIATQGFYLIHHFGRDGDHSYTYSVGMNLQELPEVIVFGLPQVVASYLLFDICEEMKRGYTYTLNGPNYGIVHNQAVYFKPVVTDAVSRYMKYAKDISPERCHAVQVFWPDPKGNYPWDVVKSPATESHPMLFTVSAMS